MFNQIWMRRLHLNSDDRQHTGLMGSLTSLLRPTNSNHRPHGAQEDRDRDPAGHGPAGDGRSSRSTIEGSNVALLRPSFPGQRSVEQVGSEVQLPHMRTSPQLHTKGGSTSNPHSVREPRARAAARPSARRDEPDRGSGAGRNRHGGRSRTPADHARSPNFSKSSRRPRARRTTAISWARWQRR